MMAAQQKRRRQRRMRRREAGDEVLQQGSEALSLTPILSRWNWRTLPVFAAFAAGIVVMGIFAGTGLALVVFFIGVFCLALVIAHVVRLQVIAGRRGR